jgi:hypothetical protein
VSFRDQREAQQRRIESLERELEETRLDAEKARAERDRAVRERDAPRDREEPIRGAMSFPRGTSVYVEWNGTWWNARVLEVVSSSEWKIRYDGWSSRWDEVVSTSRIAGRDAPPPGPRAGVVTVPRASVAVFAVVLVLAGAIYLGVSLGNETATMPAGAPAVSSAAELAPQQAVWIEWNGTWFSGEVVSIEGSDAVRVRYDGYSSSPDETVSIVRLRRR